MERKKSPQTFDQSEYIFGERFMLGGLELDLSEETGPELVTIALTHRDSAPDNYSEDK
jgi:hypothetical protein